MKNTVTLCLDCSAEFRSGARYVLQTLFRPLGMELFEIDPAEAQNSHFPLIVYYGNDFQKRFASEVVIRIGAARYYHSSAAVVPPSLKWLTKHASASLPNIPQKLYALYNSSQVVEGTPLYYESDSNTVAIGFLRKEVQIAVDVIATAFYLLTLENERQTNRRDVYGRFQKEFSPLPTQIYDFPIIDAYIYLFKKIVQQLVPPQGGSVTGTTYWPHKAPFAVALSHDVDRLQSWTLAKIQRAFWRGVPESSFLKRWIRILSSVLNPHNWSGNFPFICQLEAQYGATSTYFFMAQKRVPKDPRYSLKETRLRRGLQTLANYHVAVELHGSFNSYVQKLFLRGEKRALEEQTNQPVIGIRQHYLRFDLNRTFSCQELAGFQFDSTLGFDTAPGYRAGTSLPFYPFDLDVQKPRNLLEIPLILMDTVLWLENNLYLDISAAWEVVEELLHTTKNLGGLLTINWHNNNIHPQDVTGFTQLYEKILQWSKENGGWVTSLNKVYQWWVNGV